MAKGSKEVSSKKETSTHPEVWHPLSSMRDEFDDLFERFSSSWPMMPSFGRERSLGPMRRMRDVWGASEPAVDILDRDDAIEVRADLPGMAEKDIGVEVTDSMLTISGEKKEEREEGKKGSRYYLSERKSGSFERSFRLPEGLDQDKISAKFANGVLVVTLPKSPEAQKKPKKIGVEKG